MELKKIFGGWVILGLLLTGCSGPGTQAADQTSSAVTEDAVEEGENMEKTTISQLHVGQKHYRIRWADTQAARELQKRLPIGGTFQELNGNEKYLKMAQGLPAADQVIREIHRGDLMLYDGHYLVVFYDNFRTSYCYTPLGHLEGADDLADVLGKGNISLELVR